ncbi:Calreticulin-domain-containing protein [Tilletiaria anomala UBC 951]|uniref:Calnexin n=1 Tax=Tilletiaria anomala (strain ATCC 24038 / CBS 436.72 / UBC 951) TaxID=1037660 RepID=A0A066WHF2_TILAU|nr:Calreticulin-domain-containing protein [Tilletiaria anomala UBC 951]KDN53407.1 Calreticulin-domain-containing protein [Tilletiaria anomala UBC 951]
MKSAPFAAASAAAATTLLLASPALVHADTSGAGSKPSFEPTNVKAPFLEQFTENWSSRWSPSAATKEQSGGETFAYNGRWSVEEPAVFPGLAGDAGLVAKSKASQHAISAQFDQPVDMAEAGAQGKPLVVQYEVKLQKGLSCGGAYLKLLTESPEGIQAKEFSDKTPYTIMFGPDKCGTTNKVHFIFRHKNPVTGEVEEKHLTNAPYPKISKTTALYTLVVRPDNTFNILINGDSKRNGTLLDDFAPPVNPPKEIDDPEDKKPSTWVDDARIPDPKAEKPADWDENAPLEIPDETAVKPEGWLNDEPLLVADPEAAKPEEWDEEEDGIWTPPNVPNPKCEEAPGCGEWVRPVVRNPEYKGKWSAPYIDNPDYKGPWAPRKIDNPAYFEDLEPYKFSKIGGIGFEIWTMDEDILFDNIYIGHSEAEAKKFADETFGAKSPIEQNIEKKEEDAAAKKAAASGVSGGSFVDNARQKLNEFIEAARVDPVAAIKEQPAVAGGVGAAVAGLVTLLGIVGSLLGGGSSSSGAKKAAQSAKAKGKEAAAKAKSSAVKAKDEVKKRTAAVTDDADEE